MKKFGIKKEKAAAPGKEKEKTISKMKNWYQDRYERVTIQRNMLFVSVAALFVILGLVINGIIALNSTKVYEPFIVQIEENTGTITKVSNTSVRELPAEKAVRNSSLVRYVLAREGYNFADYKFSYYQIVRLMSSRDVFAGFSADIDPGNPNSPLTYGFESKVDVRIKSLVDLNEKDAKDNLVQIRISKAKVPARGITSDEAFARSQKSYIITLRYEYRDLNLSETERYINPLGMQVVAYSISEEVNAKNL